MRKIILCTDDYAYNQQVSDGILQLATTNKISAISCMSNTSEWPIYAEKIKPFINKLDLGMHFNLSTAKLVILIIKSNLHQIKPQWIEEQFMQQLAGFRQTLGKLPDFIDGHQHIHQLPIICDTIIKLYPTLLPNRPYFRLVANKNLHNSANIIKQSIISLVSSWQLEQKLIANNIPYNNSFSGIYNFNHACNYQKIFPRFLTQIENGGIIMCHPGTANGRQHELEYFLSEKFTQACQRHSIKICRFNEI